MFSFRMNAVNCNHLRNRTLTTSLYSSRDSWAWYSSCPYVTVVLNSAAPCFYLFIYLFIYLVLVLVLFFITIMILLLLLLLLSSSSSSLFSWFQLLVVKIVFTECSQCTMFWYCGRRGALWLVESRDLTQNTMATATRTSTNKSLNEQNNGYARAF